MALGNLSGQVGTLRDPDGHFTSCRGAYVIVAYATVTDRLDSYEILTDILATRANPRRQWRTFISLVRATKQRIARSAGILPPASCNVWRSEEHTSELQSLMRISYAVFCLKKKKNKIT